MRGEDVGDRNAGFHRIAIRLAGDRHQARFGLRQQIAVDKIHGAGLGAKIKSQSSTPSQQGFVIDQNRCILCTRCVRVCEEIEGAHTWDVMGRGIDANVITDLNQPWGSSETCTGCGKCVHVCPTGALFEKGRSVAEMLKRRNFLPYLTLMREERD